MTLKQLVRLALKPGPYVGPVTVAATADGDYLTNLQRLISGRY